MDSLGYLTRLLQYYLPHTPPSVQSSSRFLLRLSTLLCSFSPFLPSFFLPLFTTLPRISYHTTTTNLIIPPLFISPIAELSLSCLAISKLPQQMWQITEAAAQRNHT